MGGTGDQDLRLIVKRHGLVIDERIVDKETLTVGRDPTCDLVLDDPSTSRHVGTFYVIEDEIWVEDAGSIECIRVNGENISERRALHAGDWIEAGPFRIEPAGSDVLPAASGPEQTDTRATLDDEEARGELSGHSLILPDGSCFNVCEGLNHIGRGEDVELHLASTAVSKHHAVLEVSGATITVRDLGSTNGTSVNGTPIVEQVVKNGDRISFGNVSVVVDTRGAKTASADATAILTPDKHRRQEPGDPNATIITGADILSQAGERAPMAEHTTPSFRAASLPPPPEDRPNRLRLVLMALMAVAALTVVAIALLPRGATEAPVTDEVETPDVSPVEVPSAEELFAQGTARFEDDLIFEAIELWEQAVVAMPENDQFREQYGQVLFRVGYVFAGAGRPEQAREAWQRLVDHLPDHQADESVIKARSRLRGLGGGR